MQLIAHRVFEDHRPSDEFDKVCLKGFDGAEFDLRSGEDGQTYVFHAPFIRSLRGRRLRPSKRLEEACRLLGASGAPLKTLILDIKTLGAAAHAVAFLQEDGLAAAGLPGVEPLFLCWHREEAALIRASRPGARILFVIAPLVARRALRLAPGDLYAANHFPYLAATTRFRPRRGRYNTHNINVRMLRRGLADRLAPPEADGICLHKMFLSPLLAEIADQQALTVASFGFKSIREAREAALRDALDYAIISGPKTSAEAAAQRRAEARRRLARRQALSRGVVARRR